MKKKERNELTAESRLKNDEIQNLKTKINKNIETLQLYESYMKFLMEVADKNVKEKFEQERERRRRAKAEAEVQEQRWGSKGRGGSKDKNQLNPHGQQNQMLESRGGA
jgi:vacuolar-type H+-ATPase catalytic subunit A/Vma1